MQATETGLPEVTEALKNTFYDLDSWKHVPNLHLTHLADAFIQSYLQMRQDTAKQSRAKGHCESHINS